MKRPARLLACSGNISNSLPVKLNDPPLALVVVLRSAVSLQVLSIIGLIVGHEWQANRKDSPCV